MIWAECKDRAQRSRERTRQGREFCVTCVDLLYLRHVGHRQTISMPSSEFC